MVRAEIIEISHLEIRRHNFKTVYELLVSYPSLTGYSYGQTGQPVNFYQSGKPAAIARVYLDSLLLNDAHSAIYDLSDISIEKLEKIIINTNSAETAGLRIDLISDRARPGKEHESRVFYNDAYFNHRDLAFTVKQNFTAETDFRIFAQITDYMDNREYADQDFLAPYEKQDYTATLRLPDFWLQKPLMEGGFFRKKFSDFSLDSLRQTEERYFLRLQSSLPITITGLYHSLSAAWQKNVNSTLGLRNCDRYSADLSLNWQISDFNLNSISNYQMLDFYQQIQQTIFSENLNFNWHYDSLITIRNENWLSLQDNQTHITGNSAGLELNLPMGISLAGNSTYRKTGTSENTLINDAENLSSELTLSHRKNLASAQYLAKIAFSSFENLQNSSQKAIYGCTAAITAGWLETIDFNLRYFTSLDRDPDLPGTDYTLNSEIGYHQQFYNGQLTINILAGHRYTRYFPGYSDNRVAYANNLSFKTSAKILNCEIFFGMENLLKKVYTFEGNDIEVNPHYFYQTVPGYDMPHKDEIWGIRWTFYN